MCWTTWEAMKALDGKRAAERALFHAVPHEHWRLDFPAESSEEFRIKQCPEPLPALPSWLVPHLASAGHQQTSAHSYGAVILTSA